MTKPKISVKRHGVYHCQPFSYYYMYSRPSYRQAVEVLSRIWTLLSAVQKCCWHVSQHTSLSITVQFPPKPNWPERTMLWVLYQQYNNVEQHWATYCWRSTRLHHNIIAEFNDVCHKSPWSYLCWVVEWTYFLEFYTHSVRSFYGTRHCYACLLLQFNGHFSSTADQHIGRSSSRPSCMQDGQSYVWASGGREREGMPFHFWAWGLIFENLPGSSGFKILKHWILRVTTMHCHSMYICFNQFSDVDLKTCNDYV